MGAVPTTSLVQRIPNMRVPLTRQVLEWYRRPPTVVRRSYARLSADLTTIAPHSWTKDEPRGVRGLSGGPARVISEFPERAEDGKVSPVCQGPQSLIIDNPAIDTSPHTAPTETACPEKAGLGTQAVTWPARDTSNAGAASQGAHDPRPDLTTPSSHHSEPSNGNDDDSPQMLGLDRAVAVEKNGDIDHRDAGCWLPLRDAVQVIGSLEYLYRLAIDGRLPSRDGPNGQIEVWLADHDRDADGSTGPVEVDSQHRAFISSEQRRAGDLRPDRGGHRAP